MRETHTPQMALAINGVNRALNPETNLMSYGMGWLIQDYRGQLLLSHAGAIDGFRAQFMLLPRQKLGIALLMNLHQSRINLALGNSLVDLFLGLPARDWNAEFLAVVKKEEGERRRRVEERLKQRQPNTKPTLALPAYAGTYEHPAYGKARVAVENGVLILRWSNFRCDLEHFHHDTFLFKQDVLDGTTVTFVLSDGGSVTAMDVALPLGVRFKRK